MKMVIINLKIECKHIEKEWEWEWDDGKNLVLVNWGTAGFDQRFKWDSLLVLKMQRIYVACRLA